MITKHEDSKTRKYFFSFRVPLYLAIAVAVITFFSVRYFNQPNVSVPSKTTVIADNCSDAMDIRRSRNDHLTHPSYLYDIRNENARLSDLKEKLIQSLDAKKSSNGLKDISLYYRNLIDGSWFEINGGQLYNPASLMKVPFLIAILRQSMSEPGYLDKKIFFKKHFENVNKQNIIDFELVERHSYTLKELLYYMIVNSDNDAAELIRQNTNPEVVTKLFTDLGIPLPPSNGDEYFIDVVDYCKFFRVLFNSSYLKSDYSDFALDLLSQTTYKDGFLKDVNFQFPVAHKFGERVMNGVSQLHEVGIFYLEGQPYLLGVMTSGHDLKGLSSMLALSSQIVYEHPDK